MQSQTNSRCRGCIYSGTCDSRIVCMYNETPALNALKALRGAPISMGRGEIPVELLASSRPFFASLIFR